MEIHRSDVDDKSRILETRLAEFIMEIKRMEEKNRLFDDRVLLIERERLP